MEDLTYLTSALGQFNESPDGRLILTQLLLHAGVQRQEGETLDSPLTEIAIFA